MKILTPVKVAIVNRIYLVDIIPKMVYGMISKEREMKEVVAVYLGQRAD